MIKNIIFDWSGVINDNRETTYLVVLEIFKKFGVPAITMDQFRKEWEQPFMLFYNKFIPNLTMDDEVEAYKEAYITILKNHEPKPYTGIVPLLKNLKENGTNLIIISSDHLLYLQKEIGLFGLEGVFDEINCDVHDKSKNLAETIQRNKFNPRETIFIGDTQHEIEAGKSANLLTGAVTWGIHSKERLTSANPDYIMDSPDDLAKLML